MADGQAILEPIDTGSEVETEIESTGAEQDGAQESGQDSSDGQQQNTEKSDDPYSSKASREYSQWLKGLKEANPEVNGKFARIAKDDHARLFQLNQMEPRGIEGVREKYALLDSVMHGELKGIEAVGALQDELRGVAEVDTLLAAGDPRALEALGDDFNEGLAKLAPSILDRVRQSDPEAYAAAILPHFVEQLKSSELVQNYNALVDVLNEQMPSWLPQDKKDAWNADRMQRVFALAGGMGNWLNAQAGKAGKLPQQGTQPGKDGKAAPDKLAQERQAFEKQQQDHHWNTNINPGLDQHANKAFQQLMAPYAKRLKLDSAATGALKQSFIQGVVRKAASNKDYMGQITRYHSQKNPDPKTVLNFARVEFDKHAKGVLESIVKERYGAFLAGRPKTAATSPSSSANAPKGPVGPNVTIVGAKPANIDYKRTPIEWMHQKKYYTTDGKIVQVRK